MPRSKRRILLAPADNRAGLAVLRSLSRGGFEVLALVTDRSSWVTRSRHLPAERCFEAPHPERDPEGFARAVTEHAVRGACAGVLPLSDAALAPLESARSEWPATVVFMGPSAAAARAVLDKDANLDLARRLGVPCPTPIALRGEADIAPALERHPLPWVLKLADKSAVLPADVKDFTLLIPRTESELRAALARLWTAGLEPQVQEYFAGGMHVLCCFAAKGSLLAVHEYVSLRRSQHSGVLREITDCDPRLRAHAERLLAEIGWEGVACLQFLVNETSGEICYLETNGRFWASVQGSVHAGWDFPLWTARYFLDAAVPAPPPLRLGSRTCYHRADLELLLGYLKGGPSPGLGREPGKLRAMVDYLAAFGPGTHSEVFRWSDPLPALADHAQLLRRLMAGRISRRKDRKSPHA